MNLLKAILLINLALFTNLSNALVMPASGSSLIVDKSETLYVNDGDIFDLSSFNITSTGRLDIFGNSPSTSFSILTANNFLVDGYLNLFISNTFIESTNITINGIVNVQSGGTLNLTARNMIFIANGASINVDSLNARVTAVPEPEVVGLLLAGLAALLTIRRKTISYSV